MSGDNALSSSLTDMMTSLMVIFILLLVNFLHTEQQASKEAGNSRDDLIQELTRRRNLLNDSKMRNIEIKKDPEDPLSLLVIIPETENEQLFNTGESIPSPHLTKFLESMGREFIDIVTEENWHNAISTITIEGHTDRVPYKNSEYGNLELSQQRSKEVLEKLLVFAVEKSPVIQRQFWKKASAAGRADQDCHETKKENDANCRRVEFKIRVKSTDERRVEEQRKSVIVDQPHQSRIINLSEQSQ